MNYKVVCTVVIILTLCADLSHQQDTNITKSELRKYILDMYGNRYAPPENKGEIYILMNVALYLRSINLFDEVNGHLQSTTLLAINWHDERLKWDSQSTGIEYLTFSSKEIWVPSLIIENSIRETFLIDPSLNYMIRAVSKGWAELKFPRVLDSKCYASVKYFPFDKHQCNITLAISESISIPEVVSLYYFRLLGNISILKNNAQWEIIEGKPSEENVEDVKIVNFPVNLQRKSIFIVVTLIVPIIFLCLVNVLVFFIPPGSGERMSFAITVLLAFSVYMSIVSEKVPESDPMPLYNLFLIFKLTYSATIALCGIVSLRVYEKEGKVNMPKALQNLVICLNSFPCCCKCGKSKRQYKQQKRTSNEENHVSDKGPSIVSGTSVSVTNVYNTDNGNKDNMNGFNNDYIHDFIDSKVETEEDQISEVTWKTVSVAIDNVCCIVFSTIVVVEVVLSFVFTFRLINL